MIPVGLLASGEKAEVLGMRPKETPGGGKGEHNIFSRLEDMGLRIGQTIEMLSNEGKGPILLKVGNSRIAIGRGVAMKIMVATIGR